MQFADATDTICALSTPPGIGAIALVRMSGPECKRIAAAVFSKNLENTPSHKALFGIIKDGEKVIDEVVLTLFKGPNSFTGEDVAEISCHGSPYIQEQILNLLISKGCRMAEPGEFTMRAFLNKKMDLSQAEAVADVINANSAASHKLALDQMRGGFSKKINELREELINFASLIELELDFSEEDVEFANRTDLKDLVNRLRKIIKDLMDSFSVGNVLKNGVPVAIIGAPNMGKSTLLNALLEDERAIVSEIAGTTRDTIEDVININGISFRFVDTAGIRETSDIIENKGIERALEKAKQASVVLLMVNAAEDSKPEIELAAASLKQRINEADKNLLIVANKSDMANDKIALFDKLREIDNLHIISALRGDGVDELKKALVETINSGNISPKDVVVSNVRHFNALSKAYAALSDVSSGLDSDITGDFLAIDIRQALHHLGEITGQISTDDLLSNIFSKFCIGK